MTNTYAAQSLYVTVPKLNDHVRHAAQSPLGFAQVANAPLGKALGLNQGDVLRLPFYGDLSVAGGEISESDDPSLGSLTPIYATLTIKEYAGGTTWTGKLEDLSELPIEDNFMVALMNDMKKLQNKLAYDELNSTKWYATFNSTADEFVTDGNTASFTNVANEQLSFDNLRYVALQAAKRNVPFWDGESYLYITGPESTDAASYDANTKELLRYDSGRAALNGEVGRIGKCRLVVDNHKIAKVGGSSSGAGLLLDVGFLVGADALINEYAIPPEIRAEGRKFGRFVDVIYYFMGGWKKPWSQDNNSHENVIKVTSK